MPGLGQPFMPRPQFMPGNPYWRDYREWAWLRRELRPRNNARDFLKASAWEVIRVDVVGAHQVRMAVRRGLCDGFIDKTKENK